MAQFLKIFKKTALSWWFEVDNNGELRTISDFEVNIGNSFNIVEIDGSKIFINNIANVTIIDETNANVTFNYIDPFLLEQKLRGLNFVPYRDQSVVTGSGIVDAPAIPGTGATIITFDQIRYHALTAQTGNIVLQLNTTPNINKNGRVQVYDINGTPPFTWTHPANSVNSNGVAFDPSKNNVIYYDFVNGKLKHNITLQNLPDVVAPTLVSAIIQASNPSNIVLTYSEPLTVSPLPAFSDFVLNLSKTVTAISIVGSVVTLTVNAPYISGNLPTISYTSGVNKIKDLAGNIAVNLAGQAVTNNVNAVAFNTKSIDKTLSNILTSVANPIGLSFSTGSGGVDSPFSISFWVYPTINASGSIIQLVNTVSKLGAPYDCLVSPNSLAIYLVGATNNSIYIGKSSTNGPLLNQWSFITFTYNGSKTAGGINIYKNGVLLAMTDIAAGAYTGAMAITPDYKLSLFGVTGAPSTVWNNGYCDELAIINKALSQSEITEAFNSATPNNLLLSSFASNIKSYYRFENNLNDLGTNAYNLTESVATVYSTIKP